MDKEKQIYIDIGKKIKMVRESMGWTQQQLGEKLDLTRSSIANIEVGRQKMQVHTLYEFASVLNLELDDLLPSFELKNSEFLDEVEDEVKDFIEIIISKDDDGEDEK